VGGRGSLAADRRRPNARSSESERASQALSNEADPTRYDLRVPSPLLLIGLDVGDPQQLQTWMAEGRLPALASILARGAHGRLTGPEMTCEHAVWTTVFSGRSMGDHGYYYYRVLKPGTYALQPITGEDIGAGPFWAAFAGSDRRCAVIDAPDVRPVTGIRGVQLSDWAIHNASFPAAAEPPSIMARVRAAGGEATPIDEALESDIETDRRLFRALRDRAERKGRICHALMDEGPFDLTVAVFSDCHTATHQFWKYRPEAGGPETELRHATREIYEVIDRHIAALLARMPPEAHVIVVGSTGMVDLYPTGDLMEPFCRLLGWQATPAPAAPSLHPLAIARRMMPEALRVAISRRFPRPVRERLMSDAFRAATDWSRTRAFGLPSAYTGFIRVNLRGREPRGIVSPGAEYVRLLDEIESELWKIVDSETGRCHVATVTRTAATFGRASEDAPATMPDLFVEFAPSRRWMDSVDHPRGQIRQRKPEFFRDSDHSRVGFIAMAGPRVAPGVLGDISPLDVAPTCLSLLDAPLPAHMGGRVLTADAVSS
jgi:predicted AlkP superfamily phosphohydrolase/phosphomutase